MSRFDDWVIRKTQENPGRTIFIGFIPAICIVIIPMVWDMLVAIRDDPIMAIFYVPLLVAMAGVSWMVWAMARLTNRLKDRE